MRFDDVWIAGTGSTHGDLVPIDRAVADGSYSSMAMESTGMRTFSEAGQVPAEMALTAAQEALKAAEERGVQTGQDTLHLHSHASFQGIDMWSAACWLAGELLGPELTTMPTTVAAWSNGSLACLDIAASKLSFQPDIPNALITLADKFGPPADRFHTSPGMVFGDGAAAAVVCRGGGRLRLVSCVAETDTVLGGLSRGDEPFRDAPDPTAQPDMRRRTREFLAGGRVSLRDVQHRTTERIRSVVSRALAEAEVAQDEVDWLVTPFVGRTLYRDSFVLPLGFTPRHNLLDLGLTRGHLGASDQIYALDHLLKRDLLEPGARVLVIGTGMGFTFSAAVISADSA
ncbi:3-oxoacyl-[acyl-carrier-protein] synthase III C-terminal domain-containing protein [Streptomyces sp. NPDC085927]|uniref:3-oxoacyl-[acyl-carrier-protein] synthase III C-terminal domain-containing protein n=1 Tax=Streptomyces sp. NPDC085927 TaxID=3365738 RepID=UPI0037CF0F28